VEVGTDVGEVDVVNEGDGEGDGAVVEVAMAQCTQVSCPPQVEPG
jgi:hypothetical protein